MTFEAVLENERWDDVTARIAAATAADVERSLGAAGRRSFSDFLALVSPAARPYLPEMAELSQRLTERRFGRTVQLYAPLYLSNECQNICTYCGFSLHNKIARKTLDDAELEREARIVKSFGFDHILLVSGEAQKTVGVDYFERAVKVIRPFFSHISLEVQPLEEDEYRRLIAAGVQTVLVYQETYNRERYRSYHPKGKKSNFGYRLETPDRLGRAGIWKVGLGALLGLEEWRTDSAFVALHLEYLRKRYWRTKYSISFPRLRPAEGYLEPNVVMTDRDLVQLICAFRLFDENVELSISTRESPMFRDNVVRLGVTSMSAGSKTEPGGYANPRAALAQFEVSDERTPAEVAAMIAERGYEPVWKDWDPVLQGGVMPRLRETPLPPGAAGE